MKKIKTFLIDLLKNIIIAFAIVVLVTNFIFKPVIVDGNSMYPTLIDGSYGIVGIINRFMGLDRFDIVTIKTNNNYLVKRIIGLPFETVKYKDNKLYINDEYIEEPFLTSDVFTEDFEVTLGDDEYFCLGDNREHSSDSRFYGPFKDEDIKTRGIFIIKKGHDE